MLVGVGKKLHFGEKKTRVSFEINLKKIVFLQSSCYKPNSIFKVSCEKSSEKFISRDVNVSLLQEDGAMFSVNFDQMFQISVTLYQDETCMILNDYLIKTVRFIIKQLSVDGKSTKDGMQDVGSFSLNVNEFAPFNEPVEKEVEFMESLNKGFVALSVRNVSQSPIKNFSSERRNSYGEKCLVVDPFDGKKETFDENKQSSPHNESLLSNPKYLQSISLVGVSSEGSLKSEICCTSLNSPADIQSAANTCSSSATAVVESGIAGTETSSVKVDTRLEDENRRLNKIVADLLAERGCYMQLPHRISQTNKENVLLRQQVDRLGKVCDSLELELAQRQAHATSMANDLSAFANTIRVLQLELQRGAQTRQQLEAELQRKTDQLRTVLVFVEDQIQSGNLTVAVDPQTFSLSDSSDEAASIYISN